MVPELRQKFNDNFTQKKYEDFLEDLNSKHPGDIMFRVAETPIFIPKDFTAKVLDACEAIVDFIVRQVFKEITKNDIPTNESVPKQK